MKQNTNTLVALSLVCALLFAIGWSIPASSDNLYASIRGSITDPAGAVMPGVKVSATNVATGITYTVTSNNDGAYAFLQLPVGGYTVRVEMTGFKTFETSGIKLDLNQVYSLNVKMEVGTVSQSLVVEANSVQVETTSMQLGTTITGNQIEDFPLNGRNWTQLQQLEPGIVGTSDRFGGMNGGYSGNGNQTQQNSFLINGTDSNDSSLNVALVIPSPDAIGEFRMVTNTLNPEYGRNSGSIINAVIKNGTNQFHGDAFEFYRDTFMDAKSWFELEASPFHQNQFGGTLGGPIIKNHAFFFFSYQGLRATQPQQFSVPTVLTTAERSGDFSALTGGAFPLTNPATGATYVSPVPLVGSNGTTYPAGTPYNTIFSNGVIPTADLNPLAVKLLNQFVPLPNAAGNAYYFNPVTAASNNQYVYRVDEKVKDSDALWFYGLYETNPETSTLPFTGATLPGFAADQQAHTQEYTLAWNHTLSSTALNEARFAYLRFNFNTVNPVNPINPTTYGFTGILPQVPNLASLPVMTVSGFFVLGFSENGPQPRVQNTYQATDNFSKVWGHHTFKAGFNMERLQINNPFYPNLGGNFSYDGAGPYSTGVTPADFLLGFPDSYAQGSGSTVRGRGEEYYSYAQDQWQVKHSLTLTLGTGWEILTPWRNIAYDGEVMAAFRMGQQSTVFPTMPTGFVYPGDAGINKYGGMSIHYGDFAPRVGFAYSPGTSATWSVRGGIGLYYNRSEEELSLQTLGNPPFSIEPTGATVACGSPAFITPFVGATGTCSVPQAFPFTPPAPGARFNPAPYEPIGFDTNVSDPRFTSPRATNYNLTVEHQLSKSTIVSVGYVGNVARHTEGAYVLNSPGVPPGVNPAAAAYIAPGTTPPAPTCANGFVLATSLCPAAGTPGGPPLNLAVYGQTGFQTTEFNSNYNSVQVELNRRFTNGLQVLAAYTYSRYFDYTSNLENGAFNFPGINPFNVRSMYGPSANDAPQRFVVSYTYTLPFYKLTHRWQRLTDDWNLVGAYTLQHGFPIPVFNLLGTSLDCDLSVSFYACPDRANRTSTPIKIGNPRNYSISGSPNYWFNPSAFTIPAPGTGIGDANRNPLYGPGINFMDLALEKNIHIDESKYFQLRLETFNTFNHANFANPATPGFTSEDASPIDTASFGRIFSVQQLTTNGDGRVLQLGAKFYF